jgi:diaminohydroxyphosphoribosylaminopyrimidine deaminase/5-amino-6-(5-phosphoribosylamino)uracil reductase
MITEELPQQLREFLENYFTHFTNNIPLTRPYITLSYGMSMDGKIATYTGDSKYISNGLTRAMVHELRHHHDAILVGIQTVEIDHPSLTTRRTQKLNKDAHRIILDSSLRMKLQEPLLHMVSSAQTMVVCKQTANDEKKKALETLGVNVLVDPTSSPSIDLNWLMQTLHQHGIRSLLVEGGGTVHFSFIKNNLFDDIFAQISPLILGGKDAKSPVEGQGFATLKEATRVAFEKYFQVGSDIVVYAKNLARES